MAFIIGTAGHIDHGKTELIRALTGVWTDRLPDEQRRGISIDLGFAAYDLGGGMQVGVVDVPGHEQFVKNMLAGAAGIDLVLFVVAADEGVMPQTREHLQILDLLGARRGVIALTKADLVEGAWVDLVVEEVRELVTGTFLEEAPILPVSAITGKGVDGLRRTIAEAAEGLDRNPEADPVFRLPVDRAFTIQGVGTVVTGTVWSGRVRVDEEVYLLPSGKRSRIRGLQVHERNQEEAVAGARAALALAGLSKEEVSRGEAVVTDPAWWSTDRLEVRVRHLSSGGRPLERRRRVRFHLGTAEVMGRVYPLEGRPVEPGEEGLVQLRLEKPVLARGKDRFVVRSYSPPTTIGGGEVLIPHAPRRAHLEPRELEAMRALAGGSPEERLQALLALLGPTGLTVRDFALWLGPGEWSEVVTSLRSEGEVKVAGDRVVGERPWREGREALMRLLDQLHEKRRLAPRIPLEEVRQRLERQLPIPILDSLISELAEAGELRIEGSGVRRAGYQASLNQAQAQARATLLERLRSGGFSPPTGGTLLGDLPVSETEGRAVLGLLVEEGEIVQVAPNLWMLRSTVEEAGRRFLKYLQEGGGGTVSELKRVLDGVSRKYLVPLLEYLDRVGVTRREGDMRQVGPQANRLER